MDEYEGVPYCHPCLPNCNHCYNQIDLCDVCADAYYLSEEKDECLSTECGEAEFFDYVVEECQPCSENCRTCTGRDNATCTECYEGFVSKYNESSWDNRDL